MVCPICSFLSVTVITAFSLSTLIYSGSNWKFIWAKAVRLPCQVFSKYIQERAAKTEIMTTGFVSHWADHEWSICNVILVQETQEHLAELRGFTWTTVTKDSSADILRALEGVTCQRVLEAQQISMMATVGCGDLQLLSRLCPECRPHADRCLQGWGLWMLRFFPHFSFYPECSETDTSRQDTGHVRTVVSTKVNSLQYPRLEYSTERGGWCTIIHGYYFTLIFNYRFLMMSASPREWGLQRQ